MKGFKVFNPDWTCRNFQFAVEETYKHDGDISPCREGFHFCKKMVDCFNYYSFNPENKVAEIEAIGKVITDDDEKYVTDEIKILREISWEEMLTIVNVGKGNTGHRNTGDSNTGDSNTGHRNTGDSNTGDRNTGHRNTGDRNTGYRNTGDRNTGDRNTGYSNTGDRNTGDWNTGYSNTGYRNTGDWNLSDHNSGCFNTKEHNLIFFDKQSDISWRDWVCHKGRRVLLDFRYDPTKFIHSAEMTDDEKKQYPTYEATGGYLKENPKTYNEEFQEFWKKLSVEDKAAVLTIPNFDAVKFKKITGVDVNE